jgi:hypothetical protein
MIDPKIIIRSLVEKYNGCQEYQYQITRWPDERNSRTRDIDAYAEADGATPLAVEHTRVETFLGQLQDNARFGDHYGQLEAELKHAFGFELTLTLPVFAFQKGTKWADVRDTIRAWLLANAVTLPRGPSSHQINGVPFTVAVNKDTGNRFFVARRAPSDRDVRIELIQSFAEALADKNDQLSRYRADGARTVLILESQDIALVSHASLYKAFLQARPLAQTSNIEEVWLACTYAPDDHCELSCLSGPEEMMDCINLENLEWGTQYDEEWAEALKEDDARVGAIDLTGYVPMVRR